MKNVRTIQYVTVSYGIAINDFEAFLWWGIIAQEQKKNWYKGKLHSTLRCRHNDVSQTYYTCH